MHINDAWPQYCVFLLGWIVAAALIIRRKMAGLGIDAPAGTEGLRKHLDWLPVIFITVVGVLVGLSAWNSTVGAYLKLQSGSYLIADGPIEKLVEQPWKGHRSSIFTVDGVRFSYYDYDVETDDGGAVIAEGCVREGKPARIFYSDGRILRIDLGYSETEPKPLCRQRFRPMFSPPNGGSLYRSS